MKKILSLAVISAMLVTALASCSKSDVPRDMKAASGKDAPYILYVPSGWIADTSSEVASAYSRGDDPMSVTVTVAKSGGLSASDYWESYSDTFSEVYKDFRRVSSEEAEIDGTVGMKFVFTGALSRTEGEYTTYKFTQLVVPKGEEMYLITLASKESSHDGFADDITRIAEEFRFAEVGTADGTTEEDGRKDAPEGMKYASNKVVDYDFYIPEDWIQDMSSGAVSAYCENGAASVTVTAWDVAYLTGVIPEWRKSYREDMSLISPDFTEISEEEASLGGVNGIKYRSKATVAGKEYEYLQIAVARKYMIYLITYTSSPDSFVSHLDEVEMMAKSFSFR